jgi:hypothetical protein
MIERDVALMIVATELAGWPAFGSRRRSCPRAACPFNQRGLGVRYDALRAIEATHE